MHCRHFSAYLILITLHLPAAAVTDAPTSVPLFLLETKDSRGRQLPIEKKLDQLLAYFEHESGLRFERQQLPWLRAQKYAMDGKGIIWGFSKTPNRLLHYHYSLPVDSQNVWAVTYGGTRTNIQTIKDLQGKIVSAGLGVSYGLDFEVAKNVIFKVEEDSTLIAARFKKLMLNRSNMMLLSIGQFEHSEQLENHLNNTFLPSLNEPELLNRRFFVSSKPLFYDTSHFAAAIGKYEKEIAIIDKIIQKGFENGELPKILRNFD